MSKKPCITIFTDASFHPITHEGGWGCVIFDHGSRFEFSGKFKSVVQDSGHAELMAAANALKIAQDRNILIDKPIIVLQLDSIYALGVILNSNPAYRYTGSKSTKDCQEIIKPKIRPQDRKAVTVIKNVHDETKCLLMLRHVKGHTTEGGRHAMNSRADLLANRARRG